MTYTALLHCTYANYQLDYTRDNKEKNIEDFLRDCEKYKIIWAKLFDTSTGKCIYSHRRRRGKEEPKPMAPLTNEELGEFAKIISEPTPLNRMELDYASFRERVLEKIQVPERLLRVEETPSGKYYAHSGLTDHEIEYFTGEPVTQNKKDEELVELHHPSDAFDDPIKVRGTCDKCGSREGKLRRQNTQYNDEKANYAVLCPDCQEEMDDYWKDRWGEYYREVI